MKTLPPCWIATAVARRALRRFAQRERLLLGLLFRLPHPRQHPQVVRQHAPRQLWVAETLSKGNHTQWMDAGKDAAPQVLVLCSEGQGDNSRLAIA